MWWGSSSLLAPAASFLWFPVLRVWLLQRVVLALLALHSFVSLFWVPHLVHSLVPLLLPLPCPSVALLEVVSSSFVPPRSPLRLPVRPLLWEEKRVPFSLFPTSQPYLALQQCHAPSVVPCYTPCTTTTRLVRVIPHAGTVLHTHSRRRVASEWPRPRRGVPHAEKQKTRKERKKKTEKTAHHHQTRRKQKKRETRWEMEWLRSWYSSSYYYHYYYYEYCWKEEGWWWSEKEEGGKERYTEASSPAPKRHS